MNHEPRPARALDIITRYWPVIMGAIIVIAGWVNFGNADTNQMNRISILETKDAQIENSQTDIAVRLSAIQTDLSWVKTRLANTR